MDLTRTTTFRRRFGAITVLTAPALFAVAELTSPTEGDDPAGDLGVAAAHHGQQLLSIGAGLLASVLFLPAFFALVNPVRGRGTVLTHLGGGLGVLGTALSGLALAGLDLVFYDAASPGVDRASAARLITHLTHDPAGAPLLIGHYLFALGLLLLAVGLLRARVGYRWAAICLGAAPLVEALLAAVGVPETLLVSVVTDALLVAGAAGLAWWMLTTTNAAWEGASGDPSAAATSVPTAAGTAR
jgi:hypothetical protein